VSRNEILILLAVKSLRGGILTPAEIQVISCMLNFDIRVAKYPVKSRRNLKFQFSTVSECVCNNFRLGFPSLPLWGIELGARLTTFTFRSSHHSGEIHEIGEGAPREANLGRCVSTWMQSSTSLRSNGLQSTQARWLSLEASQADIAKGKKGHHWILSLFTSNSSPRKSINKKNLTGWQDCKYTNA